MNKKRRRTRDKKKTLNALLIMFATCGVIVSGWFALLKSPLPSQPDTLSRNETEVYLKSKLTPEDVEPGLVPVIIRYRTLEKAQYLFCCVGTIYTNQVGGPELITSEHILRTDIKGPQSFKVEPLREADLTNRHLTHIIKGSKDLSKSDALIAGLGPTPVFLEPFSEFVLDEVNKNFWGEVKIDDLPIPQMRSLLSGEVVRTLGYAKREGPEEKNAFVIIEQRVRRGESGTGYVDKYGGLWVVHASPASSELERQIREEGRRLLGRPVSAVALVSGPFGGNYK